MTASEFFENLFTYTVRILAWLIGTLTWSNVLLFVGVCFFIYVLRQIQKKKNDFDAIDFLLDDQTGKASSSKLILFMFAVLSIWVIVIKVSRDMEVTELLLGVLTIFIIKEEAKRYISSKEDRPSEETEKVDSTVTRTVKKK